MGYWDATEEVIKKNKGKNPVCPIHGIEMFAADDHSRFICTKCGFGNPHDMSEPMDFF